MERTNSNGPSKTVQAMLFKSTEGITRITGLEVEVKERLDAWLLVIAEELDERLAPKVMKNTSREADIRWFLQVERVCDYELAIELFKLGKPLRLIDKGGIVVGAD